MTALTDLAKEGADCVVNLSTIAERQQISLAYLEQLFLKLRRAGLVTSFRGPGGGYSVARAPNRITIAEIMMAVDEPVKMTRCSGVEDLGCIGDRRCLTHDLWDALGNQIVMFLNNVTLGDVVDNQRAKELSLAAVSKGGGHAGKALKQAMTAKQ